MATPKRLDKKKRILRQGESQLPDGRYMYRYTDIYGKRHKVYSWKLEKTDLVPAGTRSKESLREIEAQIAKDTVQGIDTFTSSDTDLNARWDLYISAKIDIKPSTKSNYIYMWEKYVRNKLGQMKLKDINSSAVTLFYTQLYDDNCLSASAIASVHTLLCPVFDICVEDGLMIKNPSPRAMKRIRDAEKAKANDKKKKLKGNEEKKEERTVLTPKQEEAFLNFLHNDERCTKWKNLFTVLLKTGFRISELCGITTDDISLKKGVIHIRRNLLYRKIECKCRYLITSTKTESGTRDFPIYCDDLKKAIADEMSKYTDNGSEIEDISGWIFRNRYGKDPLTENNCNDGLRRILSYYNETVDDELKIRDFTCHNFRHTFATKCENKGVSERAKKGLLGHSLDKNDVTNIYVHLSFEYLQKEASKLLQED